ncbi:hypothetical protein TRVL_05616 [Trypanosoma vivax]|uniref:Uncharacterized protein n=1 Tax=Trypanosoma vivax (strain Y486) TaxID=1055687 RepID=G0U2L8_TRYVY|nr:hypothetical protein TRVL_05616 [Trypanosoma vivax]CCC50521.1 conserved hypothetical protein [Trypanosoma vivax Y486]
MTSSEVDERDAKLTMLVKTMCERVPREKKLVPDVVLQLLRGRYGAVFPEEYLTGRANFIEGLIDSFYAQRDKKAATGDADGSQEEEGEETEEEETEEAEESSEEEEGEESDEEIEDTDDDLDDELSGDGSVSNDGSGEEERRVPPSRGRAEKRQRTEDEEGDRDKSSDIEKRCRGMLECLRLLTYRVRQQQPDETTESYLEQCLIPFFKEKGLDPERFSREDARRYRIKREVEFLQSDGADLTLERTQRAGRGLNTLSSKVDTVQVKTCQFLDDE